MTPKEAEKIINQYGAAFFKGPADSLRRPISSLPCSKARVKHAFFVFVESLIEQHALTQELGERVVLKLGSSVNFC